MGASAVSAARGSPCASRSAAVATRISPCSRSCSPSSAGPAAAGPPQEEAARIPAGRHRSRMPFGQGQVPLRALQRSLRELIGRGHHGQLDVGRAGLVREGGQQLVHGRGLPVQVQPRPVTGQQPGSQLPIFRRLGMPDRLHREPAGSEPAGADHVGWCQVARLMRRGCPLESLPPGDCRSSRRSQARGQDPGRQEEGIIIKLITRSAPASALRFAGTTAAGTGGAGARL
jgi:hypothetical protein